MIWPFSKKTQANDVKDIMKDAIQFSKEKWIYFNSTMPFKESVSLQERIFTFSVPAIEGLQNNFVSLRNAPDAIYYLIIGMGVFESGTHSKKEIEEALGAPLPSGDVS